ncbi:MAG: S8 family serine peptidase [Merismopedia sp. SIO2A8]|nr:S8 family serine peptidase [Merismopedia sp. SIO2A8]
MDTTTQATTQNNQAAFDLIGLTQLRNDPRYADIDGSGMNVAVIDTGLDATHPLLRSAYVTGVDITKGSGAPIDRIEHGTHVAGTIGARDESIGVATDAGLIGLGVFQSTYASNRTIEDALEWVLQNHKQYNIVAVNLSLGGGFFSSASAADTSILYDDVQRLEAAGITVVSAAGNFYKNHEYPNLSEPAIFSSLAVGAVWQDGGHSNVAFSDGAIDYTTGADRITSFSQRLRAENVVFAPGAYITSTVPNGGLAAMAGTSMAAPIVTGAVALMQEAAMQFGGRLLTPDEISNIISDTADTIFDGDDEDDNVTNTNTSYKRLNVYRAIAEIEQRFQSVAGDANGTLQGAVRVAEISGITPTSFTGQIGRDGTNGSVGSTDVDLFQFELDTAASLSIQVSPDPSNRADFDTLLRLFDAAGNEIAFDDHSGTDSFSQLTTVLGPGTYYAGVSGQGNRFYNPSVAKSGTPGATGHYTIQFSTNAADPDGVISRATALNLGNDLDPLEIEGHIGVDGHQTIAQADVDMFKLQATDSGTLLIDIDTLQSSGFVNAYLRVFDTQGNQLAFNDNGLATGSRGQAVEYLPPGSGRVYKNPRHTRFTGHVTDSFVALSVTAGQDYFIAVSGASNASYHPTSLANRGTGGDRGSYSLSILFEGNDQNASIPQVQTQPSLNLSGIAQLKTIGVDRDRFTSTDISVGSRDVDMFRINSPNSGILDLSIDSFNSGLADTVDTTAFIFDANGQLLGSSDDVEGPDPTLKMIISANTDYYVAIAGYGNNTFDPYQSGSGSIGDTGQYWIQGQLLNTATQHQYTDNLLSSGSIQSLQGGTLQTGEIGSDRGFILGATDVDLYQFIPTTSGDVRFRTLATEAFAVDTYLRLFDHNGNELAANDNENPVTRGSSVTYSVTADTTYYVGISGAGPQAGHYNPVTGLGTGEGAMGQYTLVVTAASDSEVEGITRIGTRHTDVLNGTEGDDFLVGHGGRDSLTGFGGNDTLVGNAHKDRLMGHTGDDWLNGGGGPDRLYGHEGNDTLRGGGGRDVLHGGIGDDRLDGNQGRDVMIGGDGKDVFILQGKKSRTRIKDFDLDQDHLSLRGIRSRDLSFFQNGNATIIRAGGRAIAHLDHITASELDHSHFTRA